MSFDTSPIDESDYGEDDECDYMPPTKLDILIRELDSTIGVMEKFRECPLCGASLLCIENNGMAQRFVCSNAHILSINEIILNN